MAALPHLSALALKHVVDGACKAFGFVAGASLGEAVVGFLGQRFGDHSQRLADALGRANDHAWKALEIALAGESWWDRAKQALSRADEQAFRAQVQAFLDATPLAGLPGHGAEFRQLALRELRDARKKGVLAEGGLTPQALAEQAGRFAGFSDPQQVLRAEWEVLDALAAELRLGGYPNLAHLLALRPEGGPPLVVVAVRYFFRREIESDRELFQGLAFAQLERLGQAQEAGFGALADALAGHGRRVEELLDGVQEVLAQTHSAVQDIQQQMRSLGHAVGQAIDQRHAAQRLAAGDDKPAKAEQDLRLGLLNTLLKTPHRRLETVYPLHAETVKKDPLFYAHLAAWYAEHGEVRDHTETFIVTLVLSDFEGHRDAGLALLRELPPYEVCRVIDFIHGIKETRRVEGAVPPAFGKKAKRLKKEAPHKAKSTTRREVVGESGLNRNLPRSLKTEVVRYLREREANPEWFDGTVLVARKALKRLYALLHVKPGPRAQAILFDDNPPPDSRVAGLKRLARAASPEEQARAIVESRIPFRVAVTVLQEITPATMEALIDRMSPQELINSMGLLRRRGALDDPNLKALVDLKLEQARKDKRVSTFKAEEALKAVPVDEATRQKLEEVADERLKARGRITRSTALLVDKSGSMETAIDVGKRLAAMISAICEKELVVYAFDKMAYPIVAKARDLASWHKAFQGITANGMTSCGVAVEMMRRRKQLVEQIIMVTDEEEYDPPYFVESLLRYRRELGADPAVCIVKVQDSSTRLEDQCKRAGITVTTFDFAGDYYSLPNLVPLLEPPSELDLLMEIMDYPLPERKPNYPGAPARARPRRWRSGLVSEAHARMRLIASPCTSSRGWLRWLYTIVSGLMPTEW